MNTPYIKPDPHVVKAAEIFKCKLSEVTPLQRAYAKQQAYHQAYNFPQPLKAVIK